VAQPGDHKHTAPAYRADIDGMRAIAVVSVIVFHLWAQAAPGGYLGVDIFFVISGYLIGSGIKSDLDRDAFSLLKFYERRIRRIVPALVVVLAVSTVAALLILYPPNLDRFGRSLGAATLSLSNFYFWQTSGYFQQQAGAMPLLHTWSLAVEEQFYLLFPLIAMLLFKVVRRWLGIVIWSLLGLSLASSVWVSLDNPDTAFYLPQFRAWELLLGAAVPFAGFRLPGSHLIRQLVAAMGVALVGWAIAFEPFSPAINSIPACLGAIALIMSGGVSAVGRQTEVSRVLGSAPMRFVGLVSYSLYLWHWPLIVFTKRYFLTTELTWQQGVAIALATFALAVLSWRFVEGPFRKAKARRWRVFSYAAAAGAVLVVAGGVLYLTHGLPDRGSPEMVKIAKVERYFHGEAFRAGICFLQSKPEDSEGFEADTCLNEVDDKPNVLLLGDSHAAHLWFGLKTEFPEFNVMQATVSGCRPYPGTRDDVPDRCNEVMHEVFDNFLPTNHVDLVILSAQWTDDSTEIEPALDWLTARKIPVLVVGPTPEYLLSLPSILYRAAAVGDYDLPDRFLDAQVHPRESVVKNLVEARRLSFFSGYDALCPAGKCISLLPSGEPMMFDTGHLTPEGSAYFARQMRKSMSLPRLDLSVARSGNAPTLR
jgi:peptidoglycan/LPS O-acetylase OafA/YrhL